MCIYLHIYACNNNEKRDPEIEGEQGGVFEGV